MTKDSRSTKQKRIIESEVFKSDYFFTSEQLFDKIKIQNKKIGIATVYRLLKSLRKSGKIHSYICNKKILYSYGKSSHCHFICERCREVKHFSLDNVTFLEKNIAEDVCHFQLDVHGLCSKCKKHQ